MRAKSTVLVIAMLAGTASAIPASANPVEDKLIGTGLAETDRCDALDSAHCLLPLPNDHFTRPDPSTDTGRRLNMSIASTPRNTAGKPIDPSEYNRNDGWSPGAHIITMVPDLDLAVSGAVPITDMARYADANAPIVVINASTGERHPIWAEIDRSHDGAVHDSVTSRVVEEPRALLVRPSVNWAEGTRYVVALRNLKRSDGSTIPAGGFFRQYRDKVYTTSPSIEIRRAHMEDNFQVLGSAGIGRSDLYLAWDFTVASERNLAERILKMRDESLGALGDTDLANGVIEGAAPAFTLNAPQPQNSDTNIATRVTGTVSVPLYMDTPAVSSRMLYGLDGLPMRNPAGNVNVDFDCLIPRSASAANPAIPSLYGHGLLGSRSEVTAGNVKSMAREQNVMFCAADWWGMSFLDLPNVAATLVDLSNFSSMADRMQQGILNFIVLGRLAAHPQGLAARSAFQDANGNPLIQTGRLYYDGNSQGGIMGGAFMAVTPDAVNGVLGVPGMNYSTLLDRSVDFDIYSVGVYAAYPRPVEQQIAFHMIQLLWDRGEANGYAHHMTTDPLPNTPAHRVLLHPAMGDHQVANVSAEVEARTIGAALAVPRTMPAGFPSQWPGRHWAVDPTFGLDTWDGSAPHAGSVIVNWDSYTHNGSNYVFRAGMSPNDNIPNESGSDPHGKPRGSADARVQKGHFLRTGEVIDVCGGSICNAP